MNRDALQKALIALDKLGMAVFTTNDLRQRFSNESLKSFEAALTRHYKQGVLVRACRGIYVNPNARSLDAYVLEHIAKSLRRGEFSYISLESLLSEQGVISQIPLSVLTVMTTGRSQYFTTLYGDIEFIHTDKPAPDILNNTYFEKPRPLRLATEAFALQDLRRVNRNLDLIEGLDNEK